MANIGEESEGELDEDEAIGCGVLEDDIKNTVSKECPNCSL